MKKLKIQWSKLLCIVGAVMGFVIVQECFFLMYKMIVAGYTASAAWLTAGVGVGEAVIIACINSYISLCKVDHAVGGITFESAKARDFKTDGDATI